MNDKTIISLSLPGKKYDSTCKELFQNKEIISYQLGILTEQTNYADIQKVYCIWICNKNVPKQLHNTVTMYSFKKEDIIGTTDEPDADYDLMNIINIRHGEADDGLRNYEPIFDYLSGIFECDAMRLYKYIDISQNEAIKKGMADMKGLGQSIADKNLKKGIQQGEELKLIDLVCRKIVKGKDISQIADELEEDESTIKKIYAAAMKFEPDFDVAKIYDTLHGK